MRKITDIQREKLFDGKEEDIVNLTITINNNLFKISSILDNQLKNLVHNERVNSKDFEKIVKDEDFEKRGELIKNYYKGNLEVYYLFDEEQLYFFSFGEFQPTRFILYLESIYFIEDLN